MYHFTYKGESLYCENLRVLDCAKRFGTPLYVYSSKTILDHFFKIKQAFSTIKPLVCYSVKANSNLSILKMLTTRGAGLDIVSGGELYRAKKIKCPPQRIVYASVGKTEQEITEAIDYGILMFNVESLRELAKIEKIAGKFKKKVALSLRFNPDIDAKTHKYIATAKLNTKFGMDSNTIKNIFLNRGIYSHLDIVGIHIHLGSQITQSAPFVKAIRKAGNLVEDLKDKGVSLQYFNIGGGLGIVYDKEKPQTASEFATRILPLLKKINLKIILEPGRFIVGNAGILVTKVIYIKDTPCKRFIIVDAGMNDLLRPALYSAYHKIVPLLQPITYKLQSTILADIVGPICETADFLGKNRRLNVKEGDYLGVLGVGAYGFSMGSNYNSRCRPPEVLVKNNKIYLIRKREKYSDLTEKEIIKSAKRIAKKAKPKFKIQNV